MAIEQLRLRRPDDPWLIPVRFDECDIPDWDIGGGRTLTSIQRADLFGDRYHESAARLVAAVLRILGKHSDGQAPEGDRASDTPASAITDRRRFTADHSKADEGIADAEPAANTRNITADRSGPEARAAAVNGGSRAQAAHGPGAKSPPASKARPRWKKWGGKFLAGVATVVTGALAARLGIWLTSVAGPTAPTVPPATPIDTPGHPPGREDVSTMSPEHRFYAVANFSEFQSCGGPCWLPLYQLPTESSAKVTRGWPCEYYGPGSASSGS
jgi:hypothetical protein